mmetsp:Transcript_6937/g.15302  ORF Transcript_6937/g.15302 Transcript_6937/m.15302 type:complete len:209 (-) Transcript_6937:25-651(-)
MKITLLLTILGVAANSASAFEMPQFLRGVAVGGEEERAYCECNNDRDCASDEYCDSTSCNRNNGYSDGLCRRDNNRNSDCGNDGDCNSNEYCDRRSGNCIRNIADECRNDRDCNSNQYCSHGTCIRDGNRNDRQNARACNYKQCNKPGKSCECDFDEDCVKGNEIGANTCNTAGDLNGCCVPNFGAIAGLYDQGEDASSDGLGEEERS